MASAEVELILKLNDASIRQGFDRVKGAASNAAQSEVRAVLQEYERAIHESTGKALMGTAKLNIGSVSTKIADALTKSMASLEQRMKALDSERDPATGRAKLIEIQRQMEAMNKIAETEFQDALGKGIKGAFFDKDNLKAIGQTLESTFEGALNGIDFGDIKTFTSNIGKAVEWAFQQAGAAGERGQTLAAAAGAAPGGGTNALMLLGRLGPYAAAAAAIGGMAVEAIDKADQHYASFNKTLLEGVGSADLYGKNVENFGERLTSTLGAAREAALDAGFALKMSGEDTARVLNELGQAGITYKEIIDGAEGATLQQQRFYEAIYDTITIAKDLGISTSELAQYQNTLMVEQGMSLEQTKDTFAMISAAADNSKMSAKSFFTAIMQATSGMALYNARVQEAVGFVGKFGRIIGEARSAEFLKTVTQMPTTATEQLRRIVIAGGGGTAANVPTFERAAMNRMADFATNFADKQEQLIQAGLPEAIAQGIYGDEAKRLAASRALGQTDIGSTLLKLRAVSPEMAQQLDSLRQLTLGISGTAAQQAAALTSLTPGGRFQMMARSMTQMDLTPEGILTGKDAAMKQAAAEQLTGLGGAEVVELARIMRDTDELFKLVQQFKTGGAGVIGEAGMSALRAEHLLDQQGALISDIQTKEDLYETNTKFVELNAKIQEKAKSDGERMADATGTMAAAIKSWSDKKLFENSLMQGTGYLWDWFSQEGDATGAQARANRVKDLAEKKAVSTRLIEEGRRTGDAAKIAQGEALGKEATTLLALSQFEPGKMYETADLPPEARAEFDKLSAQYQADLVGAQMLQPDAHVTSTSPVMGEHISVQGGRFSVNPPADDFIYRPGQPPQRFSPNDTVVGFKPGGPLDRMGGGGNVTVNINGGDPGVVYRTVTAALQAAGIR
jgi:hypothetical protein